MDQDGPKPDEVELKKDLEPTRVEQIRDLPNEKLVGAVLSELDLALETYDAHVEGLSTIDTEEQSSLQEMISDLRASIDIPEDFLKAAEIKITPKVEKPEDQQRLDRGEDVGVNVEISIPGQNKLVVLNIWGSRLDYGGTYGDSTQGADREIDKPRTVNFHVYKLREGSHGDKNQMSLTHNVSYVFDRTGSYGNLLEVIRYARIPYDRLDRPRHIIDPRVARRMNGEIFRLTDELYNRREADVLSDQSPT
jgi:hypothetical protein